MSFNWMQFNLRGVRLPSTYLLAYRVSAATQLMASREARKNHYCQNIAHTTRCRTNKPFHCVSLPTRDIPGRSLHKLYLHSRVNLRANVRASATPEMVIDLLITSRFKPKEKLLMRKTHFCKTFSHHVIWLRIQGEIKFDIFCVSVWRKTNESSRCTH